MKVIVAGMSKTGTKSMNEALTLLGYKVYDVLENTWYFRDEWLDILRNGAKIAELQRMYKDVDAVCDVPCLFYWEELLEAFPDAKVILTTRDEDSWYTSLKKQFKSLSSDYGFKLLFCLTLVGWRLLPVRNANSDVQRRRCCLRHSMLFLLGRDARSFPDAKVLLTTRDEDSWFASLQKQMETFSSDVFAKMVNGFTFYGWWFRPVRNATFALLGNRGKWPWSNFNTYEEEVAKRMYRKHNRAVIQNTPKDQLLVYEVKQGWKPLCDFLEVDIPDVAFPHKNKGATLMADMRKENKIMRRLEKDLYLSIGTLLILFVVVVYRLFCA